MIIETQKIKLMVDLVFVHFRWPKSREHLLALFLFWVFLLAMEVPTADSFNSKLTRREPLHLADDLAISLEHYYIPAHYEETLDSLLVPHGCIVDRVEKLAYDITQDYEGKTIHLLCVLKGGSTFFMDLCNAMRKFHNCKRLTT